MLQVAIPMAGTGSRFKSYGFNTNKYLLPLDTHLVNMIEYAICSLEINIPCKYIFIIRDDLTEVINILNEICTKKSYNYQIVIISELTEGPASTVYTANNIFDLNEPLIVSNSDQVLNWNFTKFYEKCKSYDGCVLTYKPSYDLVLNSVDKHSFIHLDTNGIIDECREKIVLSDKALVGVHYFKTAKLFIDAYTYMISKNLRAPNGEFYLSLAYQAMIENNYNIGYSDLDIDEAFYPVGEPNDYFNYLYSYGGYKMTIDNLINNNIIYENNIKETKETKETNIKIIYQTYNENEVIVNNGIILILDGIATIVNTDICIYKEQFTKNNIVTTTKCSILHINITLNKDHSNNIWKITDFTRGWFIGDFIPSIIKTTDFEVGLLTHKKDEKWAFHYHKYMTEINILVSGSMKLNEKIINTNNVFTIYQNEIACPNFLEDCKIICIKVPSVVNDKICI
jgi:dTDP-glucose pyrophosphorylase/mannose-6-phosphate isomerase-like protein (cupin superfamily)